MTLNFSLVFRWNAVRRIAFIVFSSSLFLVEVLFYSTFLTRLRACIKVSLTKNGNFLFKLTAVHCFKQVNSIFYSTNKKSYIWIVCVYVEWHLLLFFVASPIKNVEYPECFEFVARMDSEICSHPYSMHKYMLSEYALIWYDPFTCTIIYSCCD